MAGADTPAGSGTAGPTGNPTEPKPTPPPRRRRPRRRTALFVILTVVLALGVWTAVTALLAAHRLRAVRADVARLTSQPGADRQALERELAADLRTVRSASGLLGQPGPRIVSVLPFIGRNITAERTVADASAAALQAGLSLTRATTGLANGQGGVDLNRLSAAGVELHRAALSLTAPLRRLAALHVGWTLPPVQTGVRQARDQLLGLDNRMERGSLGLAGVAGVLGGSGKRTVLVGLMNNAELRGSGGLLSAYATGTTDHGQLSLGPFLDVNKVARSTGFARPVSSPADYHAAYGDYLADTTLWKNVTMSARADESSQVLAAVAAASIHVTPDVVVLCDVPAASGIISATGPVTIAGESVSGDELTKRLLVDAYGSGSLSHAKQNARRRALSEAASQAFRRLQEGATGTPALLRALLDAVSGRHLFLWSANPTEEATLTGAGASGAIDATGKDIALVVANNLGDKPNLGNKLDYYVDRRMNVDVKLGTSQATVVQTLTLHNGAPDGLGPYVEGVAHPGEITELLSMDAASEAHLTSFTHDGVPEDVNIDRADGAQRLTTVLQLPRGETTTYRLEYRLPVHDGRYHLLLVPQALARPAQLHLHISADGSALGVTQGIEQPRGGSIDVTGPWNSEHDITVPVHGLSGLRGVLHSIAHFWTHKIGD